MEDKYKLHTDPSYRTTCCEWFKGIKDTATDDNRYD
jgi:hypothetical protein